ncbi:MAG: hypothetical protein M3Z17_05910 [Gemmatimonadota bacterium]|nr:hypothetical protein [Gemmatimonadota bacterium]
MRKMREANLIHPPFVGRAGCALLLALSLAACGAADATDPNNAFVAGVVKAGATSSLSVTVNGRAREYLLHDVETHSAAVTPLPLVILLHGSGLAAAEMRGASSMDSIANVRNFLVAYPQGVGSPSDWNAGTCCGDAMSTNVDDIAFIKAVITDVSARLSVDKKRIYVGGFSDGARMAYRAGCEMSGQLAAIAVVSGSLVTAGCAPSRLVPLIAFHGNADPSVSYTEGTATPLPRAAPASAASLPPAVKFWMATASCKNTTSILTAATTVRYVATGCGADVTFYATFGGVHAWPIVGPDYLFDASPLIVDFFQAHKLP